MPHGFSTRNRRRWILQTPELHLRRRVMRKRRPHVLEPAPESTAAAVSAMGRISSRTPSTLRRAVARCQALFEAVTTLAARHAPGL